MVLRTKRCLAVVFASLCMCQSFSAADPEVKLGLEPEWLPIRHLVADACQPTLVPSKSAPLSRLVNQPRTCVCIRGIYPVAEQLRILRSASPAATAAGITLIDFEIERQTLALDAKSSVIPNWEDVSLRPAKRILPATRQQAEIAAKDRISQVMTMALPERADGEWGALAGHPLLGDAPPGDLMFRYFDFDVQPFLPLSGEAGSSQSESRRLVVGSVCDKGVRPRNALEPAVAGCIDVRRRITHSATDACARLLWATAFSAGACEESATPTAGPRQPGVHKFRSPLRSCLRLIQLLNPPPVPAVFEGGLQPGIDDGQGRCLFEQSLAQ